MGIVFREKCRPPNVLGVAGDICKKCLAKERKLLW